MKPPGTGHQWPRSIEEAVRIIGSEKAAAKHFDYTPWAIRNMLAHRMFPVLPKQQERFFRRGWTTYELPLQEPTAQEIRETSGLLSSIIHKQGCRPKSHTRVHPKGKPAIASIHSRIKSEESIVVALAEQFMLSGARGPAHANSMAWKMIKKYGFDIVEKKLLSRGIDLTWPPARRYNGQPRRIK